VLQFAACVAISRTCHLDCESRMVRNRGLAQSVRRPMPSATLPSPSIVKPEPAPPRVRLRAARDDDRAAIRAFLGRLSASSLQSRYLIMLSHMDADRIDREIRRIFDRDAARHVVVVATDGLDVHAIGEIVIDSDGHSAELALTVEDAFQRRGLGSRLYRRLEAVARSRGASTLTGDASNDNYRIQKLLRATGRPLRLELSFGGVHFTLRIA
jgi:GNAT superfamily N-acetyltransferase